MIAWTLFAFGCAPGPSPETLIDDLRVVAVVAEPPEVAPGERASFEVTVADPAVRGVELLVWTCTDLGSGCLEGAADEARAEGVTWPEVLPVEDGRATALIDVPLALGGVLDAVGEDPLMATAVWALACEPGLCPLVEDARSGRVDPADLADPTRWMVDLPLDGVSLGLRSLAVSNREERHQNPVLEPDFDEVPTVAAGEAIDLDFRVAAVGDSAVGRDIFGYASAGGFDMAPVTSVSTDVTSLTWYAPEDGLSGDEVTLWVVLTDELGGSAVWRGTATVE